MTHNSEKVLIKKKVVTVYVVTFNRSQKLRRCLSSIFSQTYDLFEVIVVDNGSGDDTLSVLEEFKQNYSNFDFILLGENKGACFARNQAILKAKGEFITGSDDDDEWVNTRLEELIAAYSPEFSCSFANDVLIGNGFKKEVIKPDFVTIEDLKYSNVIGNQVLTSRSKLLEIGLFDVNLLAAQDYDVWFRLVEKFGIATNTKTILQKIYVDGNDRITASRKKKFGYFSFYCKHKSKMNLEQRKYQLLNIKYVCQSRITWKFYLRLFTFSQLKRRVAILKRKVISKSEFRY